MVKLKYSYKLHAASFRQIRFTLIINLNAVNSSTSYFCFPLESRLLRQLADTAVRRQRLCRRHAGKALAYYQISTLLTFAPS